MSSLTAICPFCGSKAKRFVLPSGIVTDYFICSSCNRSFTLNQSKLAELAKKMFNSKADMITTKEYLLYEKKSRITERL